MSREELERFAQCLAALPMGTFHGTAHGRRYVFSKTAQAGGRSHKLVAHELGGPDYISLNFL